MGPGLGIDLVHICCTCTSAEAQPVHPFCATECYMVFSLPTVSLTAVWNTALLSAECYIVFSLPTVSLTAVWNTALLSAECYMVFSLPTVSLTAVWNTALVLSKIQKWMCAQPHTSRTSLEKCSTKHILAAFCTVNLGLLNDFLKKTNSSTNWTGVISMYQTHTCILELEKKIQQELTNYSYPIKKEVMVTDIKFVWPQATLSAYLTPSLPWCHLKTTNNSAKFQTLKEKGCERIIRKTQNIESRCYRTRK